MAAKLKVLYYLVFKKYELLFYQLLKLGKERQLREPITPQGMREGAAEISGVFRKIQKLPPGVTLRDGTLGGRPTKIAKGVGSPKRTILYLHGGAFIIPYTAMYDAFLAELALSCDAEVWAIDYRVAPENAIGDALDDCYNAYLELMKNGVSPENLTVMGDSAGGYLTLALLIRLRDEAKPLPKTGVALSPATRSNGDEGSRVTKESVDPFFSKEFFEAVHRIVYEGKGSENGVPPYHAELKGLPKLLVNVGGRELLLDDSVLFVEKAKAAGVDATLDYDEKMFHVYPVFVGIIPEARPALERIAGFVKAA